MGYRHPERSRGISHRFLAPASAGASKSKVSVLTDNQFQAWLIFQC